MNRGDSFMKRVRTAPPEIRTVADLLDRLGGIPPDRIRFDPAMGTATEDDLLAIQCRKQGLYELVDGTIVEKAVGFREATVTSLVGHSVGMYLDKKDLGFCVGPNCLFRVARGVVRSPSLAFIAWDKLPLSPYTTRRDHGPRPGSGRRDPPERQYAGGDPAELGEYFDAGVRLAWVIDPGKPHGADLSDSSPIDPGSRAPAHRGRGRLAWPVGPAR